MTDLDSDEYDWRRRLSHTNMTSGALGKYDWRRRLSHTNMTSGALGKYDWRRRLRGGGSGD